MNYLALKMIALADAEGICGGVVEHTPYTHADHAAMEVLMAVELHNLSPIELWRTCGFATETQTLTAMRKRWAREMAYEGN